VPPISDGSKHQDPRHAGSIEQLRLSNDFQTRHSWHHQIEQQDVRSDFADRTHGLGPVTRFGNYGDVGLELKQASEAVSYYGVVVGDRNSDR
jgi:hypothetical protein